MKLSIFMSKSYSPDKITDVYNILDYWKDFIMEKKYKFFLNPLASNTTNTAKDIVIIPTEDIHQKNSDTAKTSSNFEKKSRILIPGKF